MTTVSAALHSIPLREISPDPGNPRKSYDPARLAELALSIKEHGILEPLLLRPKPGSDGGYFITAGERRFRAAKLAGLEVVPALIRVEGSGGAVDQVRLVENLQREDLNVLERAHGYRDYLQRIVAKQADLARVLGLTEAHVSQTLAVLDLPPSVQTLLEDGVLGLKHARELNRLGQFPDAIIRIGREISQNLKWEVAPTAETLKRWVDQALKEEKAQAELNAEEEKRVAKKKELEAALKAARKKKDQAAVKKLTAALAAPADKRGALTPSERAERKRAIAKGRQTRAEKVAAVELAPALAKEAATASLADTRVTRRLAEALVIGRDTEVDDALLAALGAMREHLPGKWEPAKTPWQAQRVSGAQDDRAFKAWLGVWALFLVKGPEIRRRIAQLGRKVANRPKAKAAK